MCCDSKKCCKDYCVEWTRPSLWPLLGIMTIGFTIFSFTTYAIFTVTLVKFIETYSTGFFLILFFFAFYIMILVVVYAPYQHQPWPIWYKVLSVVWYVGQSIVVAMWWSFGGDSFKNNWVLPWYDIFGEYFTPYSIGYMSTGFVWIWLIPHLFVVFGITFGFQVVQHVAFDKFQWWHWLYGATAGTIPLIILFLVKKWSFCKKWPWCASHTIADNKNAKWCCEMFIYRNIFRCCKQKQIRERSMNNDDLSFRIIAAVKAQLFLFYIKSFPAFIKIFGTTACIPFLVSSPWIDFLLVQLLLLVLVLPWIDSKILTSPKYVFLHSLMSFLIGIIEVLSGLYRINAYLSEENTYFVTNCYKLEFSGMYYCVFGIFGTSICCFIQSYYSMKLFVNLNAQLENKNVCSKYFSEWKRESIYPLLTFIGIICSLITLIIIYIISISNKNNRDELVWQVACIGFLFFYTLSIICVYSPYQHQLYHWTYRFITMIFIPILFLALFIQSKTIAFWYLFFITWSIFLTWNVPLNIGLFAIIWPFQLVIYFADLQHLINGNDNTDNKIELNSLQLIYGIISSVTFILITLIWNLCVNKSVNIFKESKFPIIQSRNIDGINNKDAKCECVCLKCEEYWYNQLCFCAKEIEKGALNISLLIEKTIKTRDKGFENNIEEKELIVGVDENGENGVDIDELLQLITENEENEKLAFEQLQMLAKKRFNLTKVDVDGDEKKSSHEIQPSLQFDNTTLELRLRHFNESIYIPSSIDELIIRMQNSVNNNQTIKAMGSRYAFSEITFTNKNGLLIDMYNGLNDPNMEINTESLSQYGNKILKERNLHLAQTGASFEMILEILWPEEKRRELINSDTGLTYKVLTDITGYNQLSVGGVISTGSSGTGTPFINNNDKNYGSIVNQVIAYSMIIIDENKKVRLVQIEPETNPIHDAKKWNNKFPNIELIQDNDIFEAGLISLGLLGVIYSYYFLLEDAYFIEEIRYMISYSELKNKEWKNLEKKINNNEIERLMIWLSPYTTLDHRFNSSPPLLISTYSRTNEKPPKEFNLKNSAGQALPGWFIKTSALVSVWLTRILPEIIPIVSQMTLQSTDHDDLIRPAIESYTFGQANSTPVKANGFGFNYNEEIFFEFFDEWIKLMNQIRYKNRNQVSALPIAIRFSSNKSKGLLNMFNHPTNNENNNAYFWIEMVMPNFEGKEQNVTATIENANGLLKNVQELSMNNPFNGNPHFGLNLFLDKNNPKEIFKNFNKDKLNKFIKIYKKFNKTKTFSNKFTKESGLDDMAQL